MKNQFGDKFPDDVVNALDRMLLPEIQKAYESAEGQAEFEKWEIRTSQFSNRQAQRKIIEQYFTPAVRTSCRG